MFSFPIHSEFLTKKKKQRFILFLMSRLHTGRVIEKSATTSILWVFIKLKFQKVKHRLLLHSSLPKENLELRSSSTLRVVLFSAQVPGEFYTQTLFILHHVTLFSYTFRKDILQRCFVTPCDADPALGKFQRWRLIHLATRNDTSNYFSHRLFFFSRTSYKA